MMRSEAQIGNANEAPERQNYWLIWRELNGIGQTLSP